MGAEASGRIVERGLDEDLTAAALALARALHADGTIWTLGTTLPEGHSVDGPDPVAAVRTGSLAGDALVVLAPDDDAAARELARRTPAWGVVTVWVGSGSRPGIGAADHVLWSDDAAAVSVALGERTRSFLRRPELLEVPAQVCLPVDGHCVTCSDEGRLGEVVEPPADPFAPARVRTATGEEDVDVTLVGAVLPGDLLLVHAGSALTILDDRPATSATSGGTA